MCVCVCVFSSAYMFVPDIFHSNKHLTSDAGNGVNRRVDLHARCPLLPKVLEMCAGRNTTLSL